MDGDGNDFQNGETNAFTGSELQGCENFPVPNHNIALLRLQHSGMDMWKPEYVRVFFDDGVLATCPVNVELDNDDSFDAHCV